MIMSGSFTIMHSPLKPTGGSAMSTRSWAVASFKQIIEVSEGSQSRPRGEGRSQPESGSPAAGPCLLTSQPSNQDFPVKTQLNSPRGYSSLGTSPLISLKGKGNEVLAQQMVPQMQTQGQQMQGGHTPQMQTGQQNQQMVPQTSPAPQGLEPAPHSASGLAAPFR